MKTNVKQLIQQVIEELKNKRTQKIMLWSLVTAVCFLILIGIFSSLGGKYSKENESNTSEEQTSSQAQSEEDNSTDQSVKEVFYVDFSQESEIIHLVSVVGIMNNEKIEVHIVYDRTSKDVFMYYYSKEAQLADILFNYSIKLEEGVAYEISAKESNGVIEIKQKNVTLCLVAVVPNSSCIWSSIVPDLGIVGESEGNSTEQESVSEIRTEEVSESETDEDKSLQESDLEESKSEIVTTDSGNVNYKALLRDIIIAAVVSLALAIFMIFAIIAVTRKINPFNVVAATVSDRYPSLKERRSWKYKQEEDDYKDDNYEEDDENDDYEEDDYEEDDYEEDDDNGK